MATLVQPQNAWKKKKRFSLVLRWRDPRNKFPTVKLLSHGSAGTSVNGLIGSIGWKIQQRLHCVSCVCAKSLSFLREYVHTYLDLRIHTWHPHKGEEDEYATGFMIIKRFPAESYTGAYIGGWYAVPGSAKSDCCCWAMGEIRGYSIPP
jgi:hypothetical protein